MIEYIVYEAMCLVGDRLTDLPTEAWVNEILEELDEK